MTLDNNFVTVVTTIQVSVFLAEFCSSLSIVILKDYSPRPIVDSAKSDNQVQYQLALIRLNKVYVD
jgi:hypothetical protein